VTVGDACFALLGQITNRAYQAVRYQPTMCFVVTSPTRDPRVARAVRAQWAGKDLRAALAARLLADFHTTGVWGLAESALEHLVAYFPEAAEGMLLREVDRLGTAQGPEAPADTLDPEQVARIAASAAAERPALREALARAALRVSGAEVLATVLEGLPDLRDEALLDRMADLALGDLRTARSDAAATRLLAEIERRAPDRYPGLLRRALRLGMEGIRAVLFLHDERPAPLAVADWRPLLPVTDPATLWQGHPPLPLERLRICDAAAVHIARLRPDLPFDAAKPVAERDARIAEIRRTLDAEAAKGEVR
jgi:hypothetical protein